MVMSITTPVITIRDLVKNYKDSGDQGVVAYHGTLNVRPAYQRAFVYEPNDRDRVMMSVYNGLPLNSMYWAINPDGTYTIYGVKYKSKEDYQQFILHPEQYGYYNGMILSLEDIEALFNQNQKTK